MRHGLLWWDALIVAGAAVAGAGALLSEDLQEGLLAEGVRAVNPFRTPPPAGNA